jgi:hypothetical protein
MIGEPVAVPMFTLPSWASQKPRPPQGTVVAYPVSVVGWPLAAVRTMTTACND